MHAECIRPICRRSQFATVWRFEQGERPSALGQTGVISMSALGQKQTCAMQTAMSALTPKADITGKFATLGSGYLNARRNATAAKLMTSTVRSITSIEPSPLSGEKPTCRSIKSMGAALLRSTQSSSVPQTAIIEPKAISTRIISYHYDGMISPTPVSRLLVIKWTRPAAYKSNGDRQHGRSPNIY